MGPALEGKGHDPLPIKPGSAGKAAPGFDVRIVDDDGNEVKRGDSGNIVMGSARIEEQARGGRLAALLHASDSSEDGRRKLDQAWRVGRETEGSGERGLVLPLDRTALSVALGRDNVVHLALTDPAAAERVALPLERLLHFLGRAPSLSAGPAEPELTEGAAGDADPLRTTN